MRSNTLKRAALNRKANKWRREYLAAVGRCDVCGRWDGLSLHELGRARGANREKSLTADYAILVLCLSNPGTGRIGCHEKVQNSPEVNQLALLWLRRPDRYDLKSFLELTSPNAPLRIEQSEVDAAIASLTEV